MPSEKDLRAPDKQAASRILKYLDERLRHLMTRAGWVNRLLENWANTGAIALVRTVSSRRLRMTGSGCWSSAWLTATLSPGEGISPA